MNKSFSIVGTDHLKTEAFVAALKPGIAATLVREPNNKYDGNAIMVWVDGVHIGYIPKKQNAALAALIDSSGREWKAPAQIIAQDQAPPDWSILPRLLALDAKFVRSPNSGYPMVQFSDGVNQ